MSFLFKPGAGGGIAGTAVDPLGPGGVLIEIPTEVVQVTGPPLPAGHTLQADGTGGFVIAAPSVVLVRTFTAGVAVRDVVFQKTDGTVDKADASGISTAATIAGVVEALNVPIAGQCRVRFAGDLTGFTGLVVGSIYILSTTPGVIVEETDTLNAAYPNTSPSSGHVIAEVGCAVTTTTLFVGTIRDFEEM